MKWRGVFFCCLCAVLLLAESFAWKYLKSQTIASLLVAGSSASGAADICERLKTYLVKRQRKICRRHPLLISSLFYGYGMAWRECKRQFMHSRWDCDGNLDRNVFELLHNKGTREAAYLLAVTSAGVAHAITKACSSGKHVHCGCDRTVYDHPTGKNHRWSGCSDNIFFGAAFTKRFIDSYERRTRKRNPALAFTKLHNNRVGRETVVQMMKVMCKCHGVTGSCELKTCWRALPSFQKVGRTLRGKFDSAVQVDFRNKQLLSRESLRAVPQHLLAFLRPSPDFCYADTEAGSVGTRGRPCNKTLSAANNCNQLCCRRGFSTRIVVQPVQCNCKFVWCCEVRCDECRMPVEVSKCL